MLIFSKIQFNYFKSCFICCFKLLNNLTVLMLLKIFSVLVTSWIKLSFRPSRYFSHFLSSKNVIFKNKVKDIGFQIQNRLQKHYKKLNWILKKILKISSNRTFTKLWWRGNSTFSKIIFPHQTIDFFDYRFIVIIK